MFTNWKTVLPMGFHYYYQHASEIHTCSTKNASDYNLAAATSFTKLSTQSIVYQNSFNTIVLK